MSVLWWVFVFGIFFGPTLLEFTDRQFKRYHERKLLTNKKDRRIKLLEDKVDDVEKMTVDAILEQESKRDP